MFFPSPGQAGLHGSTRASPSWSLGIVRMAAYQLAVDCLILAVER